MGLSDSVRQAVLDRDQRLCQLFHKRPTPATEVAHMYHQGAGGDSSDSDVNQPDNLISVCSECHRKLHGPGIPWQIVHWDPARNELEVIDPEGRPVDHEQLWFYRAPQARAAMECLARAADAVRTMRRANWELAECVTYLSNDLWQLIPDSDASSLFDLASDHLGLTASEVRQLIRVYKWAREFGMLEHLAEVSPEVADVIRRMDSEGSLARLAGTLPTRQLWDEIDKRRQWHKRLRTFVITSGPVRIVKARSADDVEWQHGEKIIRGSLLTGGEDVEVEDS